MSEKYKKEKLTEIKLKRTKRGYCVCDKCLEADLKLTQFECKFGLVCKICGKRKGAFMASNSAEGGKPSRCECEKKM